MRRIVASLASPVVMETATVGSTKEREVAEKSTQLIRRFLQPLNLLTGILKLSHVPRMSVS